MAILTVDELRTFVTTDLGDEALQTLLDATEAEIVALAGASGARTEITDGGSRFISLARPASAITSIKELVGSVETTLATDDYLLYPGGMLIERLDYGTNPYPRWHGQVTTVYTALDDEALRKAVQLALCQLDLNYKPGLAEETIGEWTERYSNNSAWNIESERQSILARLGVSAGMVVV
jgi:hypothetical protein